MIILNCRYCDTPTFSENICGSCKFWKERGGYREKKMYKRIDDLLKEVERARKAK